MEKFIICIIMMIIFSSTGIFLERVLHVEEPVIYAIIFYIYGCIFVDFCRG